ncbi:HNH endonuclease [Aldersonia sp. NBC_00410]|nr:HNH endonuclease [Aldersonia sp. NBC_00410]
MDTAEALDALNAAVSMVAGLDFEAMSSAGRLAVLRELEAASRRQTSVGYELLQSLRDHRTLADFGGENTHQVVADALRITRLDAKKRFDTAEQLASRASFTGEPLVPELAATAEGVRSGVLGDGHVQVIRSFLKHLPHAIDAGTREHAEAQLAGFAESMRPDELRKVADRLAGYLNPDGEFDEIDRARKRGLWLGKQDLDGMSSLTGRLDPELRALFEPILEKLAAPGMCNPADESPRVDGEPDEETSRRDNRSMGQRHHDAVKAMCRALLASGELGRHRGLPVTVIVSTTLQELKDLAGPAATAGGSLLPMRDLVRMAAHAHHYLCIFDDVDQRVWNLGRSKRIASPDQRIVLHARDIGCSYPGCTMAGYRAEAHHVREWADGGATDIENLTFVCPAHHKLAGPGEDQWRTHRYRGHTAWIPPRHVDPRQRPRINHFHHPGDTLTADSAGDGNPP